MFAKLERGEVSVYRKSGNIIVGLLFWSASIGIFALIFLSNPSYKISQEMIVHDVESVETGMLSPTLEQLVSAENQNDEFSQKNHQTSPRLNGDAGLTSSSDYAVRAAKKEELSTVAEAEIDSVQTIKSVVTTSQPKSADDSSNSVPAGWYVQVGAFESAVNADVERLKFSTIEFPTEIARGDDQLSRVLVGPYKSEKEAIQSRSILAKQHKVKGGIIRDFTG